VVHRGVRDPRRWWWAAAFALLITSTGGGVNAAVTGWLLVGPLLLVLYEPLVCGVPSPNVRAFAWRAAVAGVAASISSLAPRPVLPPARDRGPARDERRLSRRHAAPQGGHVHVQPRPGGSVPAHDLQGGAAARTRPRVPRRGGVRGAVAAAAHASAGAGRRRR